MSRFFGEFQFTIGRTFNQNGAIINGKQLLDHLKRSESTSSIMKNHSVYFWSSLGLGGIGGGLIGWNLGAARHGHKVNYGAVVVGLAAIGGGYYLGTEADHKVREAVNRHNESIMGDQSGALWFSFPLAQW